MYYRPLDLLDHSIFSTAKRISLAQICSTDNTKTDKKNPLLPSPVTGLKPHIPMNRYRLLLWLRKTNIAMTAVFMWGTSVNCILIFLTVRAVSILTQGKRLRTRMTYNSFGTQLYMIKLLQLPFWLKEGARRCVKNPLWISSECHHFITDI